MMSSGNDYGRVVKILMLTGQRRDEIGRLRWGEVSLDEAVIVLPPERTKNGHENIIPLSAPVLDILRSQPRIHDCVFGRTGGGFDGYSKIKKELDQRIAAARGEPIAPWVLHDLRRTFSTRLYGDLGVAPHIVEALINHTSGHRSGVAGRFRAAPTGQTGTARCAPRGPRTLRNSFQARLRWRQADRARPA
jgi:integrase